jgi:hypothetical protein
LFDHARREDIELHTEDLRAAPPFEICRFLMQQCLSWR